MKFYHWHNKNISISKTVQDTFASELYNLRLQLPLAKSSKIFPLCSILMNNLIKVGHCIHHSDITEKKKYQVILNGYHNTASFVAIQFYDNTNITDKSKLLQLLEKSFGL